MKKKTLLFWFRQLFVPAVVCLLGLSMLLRPDSASALIGRVLGWGLLLAAGYYALTAIVTHRDWLHNILFGAVALVLGCRLLRNPLGLASLSGALVGVTLLILGLGELKNDRRSALSGWLIAGGVVLILLPLTVSRILIRLLGAAILVLGITTGISHLRHPRLPGGEDDPNIIDAL